MSAEFLRISAGNGGYFVLRLEEIPEELSSCPRRRAISARVSSAILNRSFVSASEMRASWISVSFAGSVAIWL